MWGRYSPLFKSVHVFEVQEHEYNCRTSVCTLHACLCGSARVYRRVQSMRLIPSDHPLFILSSSSLTAPNPVIPRSLVFFGVFSSQPFYPCISLSRYLLLATPHPSIQSRPLLFLRFFFLYPPTTTNTSIHLYCTHSSPPPPPGLSSSHTQQMSESLASGPFFFFLPQSFSPSHMKMRCKKNCTLISAN